MSQIVASDSTLVASQSSLEINENAPVKLNKYLAAAMNPLPALKSKN